MRTQRKKLIILLLTTFFLVLFLVRRRRDPDVDDGTAALMDDNVEVRLSAAGADADTTTVAQSVFISCNRHDRDQTYWDLIAAAAVCDGADAATRRGSEACLALYAGVASAEGGVMGSCAAVDKLPRVDRGRAEAAERPLDALVWLGDAIYADKRADGRKSLQLFQVSNPLPLVKTFWVTQRWSPIYSIFRETCVRLKSEEEVVEEEEGGDGDGDGDPPLVDRDDYYAKAVDPEPRRIYGTWDDHDMGKNDGGREYPDRVVTQRFFMNFLGANRADPRWDREGVYTFHPVPFPDGDALAPLLRESYRHALCFLLLDVRSFRDAPNASQLGDMLGEVQWAWLTQRLATDLADGDDGRRACAAVLIGSGTQFMMDVLPSENWAEFPGSRDRLLGLLRQYRTERVVFLTGDIHMGELAVDFGSAAQQVLGYPLVEATSSGLTHSAGDYGAMSKLVWLWFPARRRRLYIYLQANFGTVRLTAAADWQRSILGQQALRLAQQLRTHPDDKVARRLLHPLLDAMVNLSFGIFAVQEHGRPVIRLTFPLEMLSWRVGPVYAGASVPLPRAGGAVHLRPVGSAPPPLEELETAEVPDGRGGTQRVLHYPFTTPVPFLTWLARFNQRHFFPGGSIPRSVARTLIFWLELGIATPLLALLLYVWRRRRARRRLRRRSLGDSSGFGSSRTGAFVDLSAGSPLAGHGKPKRQMGGGGGTAMDTPPSASGGRVLDDVMELFMGEGKQKKV